MHAGELGYRQTDRQTLSTTPLHNYTVEHLIYECPKLQSEREVLIRNTAKQDTWPKEKSELMNKYLKYSTQFTNSIDFDKL